MRSNPTALRSCVAACVLFALAAVPDAAAQATRAERTGYAETSTYADVIAFIDSLNARGAGIRTWNFGKSPEGRPLPVVLASRPMVSSAEDAHRSGKPIVYIQANIHAGEVEGKEAAQMLLRDLTLGPLRPLLDSVIVLVVPIYNADGNEAFAAGDVNRPGQNGPAVVGRRANGQGLDLNRDYVKMEAPETRGSADLLDRWQPHLLLDLHTTNGSYHGYNLTYSPGLNANHGAANSYVQDVFLPAVRDRMQRRHKERIFPYGNFRNQAPDSLKLGWETYDGRARYGTNWYALRGRLAILSEAYSNDPLSTRVKTTYDFVREVLSLLVERRATMLALADRGLHADSVSVRQRFADSTMQNVIAELTTASAGGSGGFAHRTRTGKFKTIRMPVWDRFTSARSEAVPAAYLIPERLQTVIELLRRQGIVVTALEKGWDSPSESFHIDSVTHGRRRFEGHMMLGAEGHWAAGADSATGHWFMVTTTQPLGMLAAYILEPASEDGAVAWNFLDADVMAGSTYPIVRIRRPLAAATQP
jgi:zinc carboxypeptidase